MKVFTTLFLIFSLFLFCFYMYVRVPNGSSTAVNAEKYSEQSKIEASGNWIYDEQSDEIGVLGVILVVIGAAAFIIFVSFFFLIPLSSSSPWHLETLPDGQQVWVRESTSVGWFFWF